MMPFNTHTLEKYGVINGYWPWLHLLSLYSSSNSFPKQWSPEVQPHKEAQIDNIGFFLLKVKEKAELFITTCPCPLGLLQFHTQ